MSDQSRPYAPAFMRTPPPPCRGSRTRTRSRRGPRRALDAGRRRSSPRRRRAAASPCTSTAASSPSSRSTSASTPSSAASTFEPSPTTSDVEALVAREAQRVAELRERARPRERTRRARRCRSSSASRAATPCSMLDHARQPLDDRARDPPRLADAERDDDVARPRPGERERRPRRRASAPSRAGRRRGTSSSTSFPVTPGMRRVAAADHVGDDRRVGEAERRAELVVRAGAFARRRAAGRRRSSARGSSVARRLERRGDLRRVVAVVVDHANAAALADELEPPPDSRERRRSHAPRRARSTPASSSAASAAAAFVRLCSPGTASSRSTGSSSQPRTTAGALASHSLEERRELGLRGVRRMVVELDVRHDGDLRPQERDRAVGLVALDDEPALARAGVPAELRDDPADDPRRIVAELAEDVRDHRRRRRLAVRAADDDRAAQRDELGEELGARATLDASGVRRRDDDLEARRAAPARRRRRRRLPSTASRKIVSRASQPRTSAPHARAKFAYAESPAPPIPTK